MSHHLFVGGVFGGVVVECHLANKKTTYKSNFFPILKIAKMLFLLFFTFTKGDDESMAKKVFFKISWFWKINKILDQGRVQMWKFWSKNNCNQKTVIFFRNASEIERF